MHPAEHAGPSRQDLTARHGTPRLLADTSAALRLLGKRDQIHPLDAVAFTYRDQAAALAWQRANLEHYGHPSLGTALICGGEVIGVLDLRPALASFGIGPTDPSLPDGWRRYGKREVA